MRATTSLARLLSLLLVLVLLISDAPGERAGEADKLTKQGSSNEQVQVLLMLGRLQALNQNPDVNKSEIEKIISAAARTFGTVKTYGKPHARRTIALRHLLAPASGSLDVTMRRCSSDLTLCPCLQISPAWP